MIGDFNEVLCNDEKSGGPLRSEESFTPFLDMLSVCEMEELEASGNRFTWAGMRWRKWIQCCLDRCFGNKSWLNHFPSSNQRFLDKRGSDHRSVLMKLQDAQSGHDGLFHFDKRFHFHPRVKKEIIDAWNGDQSNGKNQCVAKRLRDCRGAISKWKKCRRFNAKDRIHLLEKLLEWFQSKNFPCWHAIRVMKKELSKAYRDE
ncbi:hypothetical protein Bca52824_057103 [Brassica carinata]|uniref:Uncharacterized protein n=1 Tax=Brassica carinata TaxID=52824 RepID=A0A8X7QVG1_BRACI|nr:hypothetical protein Bca52824_057103 [Brassica carinata]